MNDKGFKRKFGSLTSDLDTRKSSIIIFYALFLFRRFVLVLLVFVIGDKTV